MSRAISGRKPPTGSDPVYISVSLKGLVEKMRTREKRLALDCFEHWRAECTRLTSHDPASVAFTLHDIIDDRMHHMLATSTHGREMTCRKGCAACCHMHVDVYPQEAALLQEFSAANGILIDESRLDRQSAKSQSTWRELAREDQACVYLGDDGACRVYEHRPGACRKYTVKSDPDLCDTIKHPGGKVVILVSTEAEIVHSAAMTAYGSGGMPRMLIEAARPAP